VSLASNAEVRAKRCGNPQARTVGTPWNALQLALTVQPLHRPRTSWMVQMTVETRSSHANRRASGSASRVQIQHSTKYSIRL
jgi:hypothetical protein